MNKNSTYPAPHGKKRRFEKLRIKKDKEYREKAMKEKKKARETLNDPRTDS